MTVTLRRRCGFIAAGALLALSLAPGVPVRAQRQVAPPPTRPAVSRLPLRIGQSDVVQTQFDIERFSFADPEIADGLAISRRELLVTGKKAGTISLMIWTGGHLAAQYDVVVDSGTPSLQQRLQAVFPGEDIQAGAVGTAMVLSGRVSSQGVADRVFEVAKASGLAPSVINLLRVAEAPPGPAIEQQLKTLFPGEDVQVMRSGKALILSGAVSSTSVMKSIAELVTASDPDSKVIDLMKPKSDSGVQQVLLQVRIAEVGRTALLEAGVNLSKLQIDPETGTVRPFDVTGATSTQQFVDAMNIVLFYNPEGVGAFIRALQKSGSYQTLAEPNLIAYNGKEAKFLSGGELPIVIPGTAGSPSQIQWREYGVRLGFTPTLVGDRIHLKVRPEVSAVDPANSVNINGTVVPALSTRYAETDVELKDGQSFAIAGLLNHNDSEDKSGVAGLAKIPILGALFRSKQKKKAESELLVLVTPRLVQPLNPDQVPAIPKIKKDGGGR